MKLSKAAQFGVRLANFSNAYNIRGQAVAELCALADRAWNAWELCNHYNTPKIQMAYERATDRFENAAKALGFDVIWPGPRPMLVKGGFQINLPCMD